MDHSFYYMWISHSCDLATVLYKLHCTKKRIHCSTAVKILAHITHWFRYIIIQNWVDGYITNIHYVSCVCTRVFIDAERHIYIHTYTDPKILQEPLLKKILWILKEYGIGKKKAYICLQNNYFMKHIRIGWILLCIYWFLVIYQLKNLPIFSLKIMATILKQIHD